MSSYQMKTKMLVLFRVLRQARGCSAPFSTQFVSVFMSNPKSIEVVLNVQLPQLENAETLCLWGFQRKLRKACVSSAPVVVGSGQKLKDNTW